MAIKKYVVRLLKEETDSFAFAKRILEELHQHAKCLLDSLNDPRAGRRFEPILEKLVEHGLKVFANDVNDLGT